MLNSLFQTASRTAKRVAAGTELEEGVEPARARRVAKVDLHPRLEARVCLAQQRDPHVHRRPVEDERGVPEVVGAAGAALDLVQLGHVEQRPADAALGIEGAVRLEGDVAALDLQLRRRLDAVALRRRRLRRGLCDRRRIDRGAAAGGEEGRRGHEGERERAH
jgi:hypothetical protein